MELENSSFAEVSEKNAVQAEQTRYLLKVYNWMGVGLFATGLVAYFTSQSQFMINLIFSNTLLFYGLLIGELLMVGALAGWVMKMRASTAAMTFFGYAILNGVTFSFIFISYTNSSIAATFVVTAGTFGAMSLYGAATKKDLTGMGNFLMMGLFGIIIAMVVNFFLQSPLISWVISGIGVLVFTGLTAYDTQKILRMNIIGNEGTEEDTKEAIRGALTLYLDFINLFLFLLHFMGGNRD